MQKNLLRRNYITKKYQNLVNQINNFEEQFQTLSDNELRVQSFKLKKRYQQSQNLTSLIGESFALTREASVRTLGLRHFDVQLIGGLVLNNQKIAEMRTGEGKTLVATLSASLNALTEKGVHIITINEYLASRDHASMGQIYSLLGLSTGLIQDKMSNLERKKNYSTDITYVTNYEVTFDFLRDNMALNSNDVALRPFNYCIIDEVDSVLIDEAQTPLILSDQLDTPVDKYMIAAEITNYLQPTIHYTIDEKK
jgi:preprotein translocase subunit SecA